MCSVQGCLNYIGGPSTSKSVTFHRFPKEFRIRKEWIRALGRKNWEPSKNSVVCSEHFRYEDFDRSKNHNLVRLKKHSVPNIFLAAPEKRQSSFLKISDKPLQGDGNLTNDKDRLSLEPNFAFIKVEKQEVTSGDDKSLANENHEDEEHAEVATVNGFVKNETIISENHTESEENLITDITKEEFLDSKERIDNILKEREDVLSESSNDINEGESIEHSNSTDCFKCNFCGNEYQNDQLLKIHRTTHYIKSSYTCDICGKSYSKRNYLNTHLIMHSDKKPFFCHICDKVFVMFSTLKCHMRAHRDCIYKCHICSKTLSSTSTLNRHIALHNQTKKRFPCSKCHKSFKYHYSLKLHLPLHYDVKPFPCDLCDRSYISKRQLSRHLQHNHGKEINRYNCSYCREDFKNLTELNAHTLMHSAD